MASKEKDWLTCSMESIGAELIRIATDRKQRAEEALNIFLDYGIKAFDIFKVRECSSFQEWTQKVLSEDEEYNHILMRWMQDVNKSINNGETCDFFGHTYESTFQGRGKASSTGQFFTPESISTLMSKTVNYNIDYNNKIITVSDCCCGSGRLLLGFLADQLANREELNRHRYVFYAEDIDIVSCKMTALNLMAHCLYGSVVCHDVLRNNPPHTVYIVNECQVPYPNATMGIRTLTGEQAERWWLNGGNASLPTFYGDEWQGRYDDEPQEPADDPVVAEEKKEPQKRQEPIQLTLFDDMF